MNHPLEEPNVATAVVHDQTRLSLPSRINWIEPTVEYLKTRALLCGACLETQARKLTVALHEALNNAVVHGNLEISSALKDRDDNAFIETLAARSADPRFATRTVEILVDYDGRRCQWTLTDQGQGFDFEKALGRDPLDEAELLRPSGRGILMMRAFLDEVRYEAGGRRVVLTLEKVASAEQRHQPRVPCRQPLRLMPIRGDGSIDWEAAQEAVSHNLSQDGMAILQAKLTTTDRVLIALQSEGQPLYLLAEVRHCRALGEDMVELGCRFQTPADLDLAEPEFAPGAHVEEAVALLVERLGNPPLAANEQRVHPRVVYPERIEIAGNRESEPKFGFARDLSRGGIAFITIAPLALESVVLSLPQKDRLPLRVRAQIVRCVKIMEGFYDIGARFVSLESTR